MTVLGLAVLGLGVALLALPGPGVLVIALGFLILSTEYDWARRRFEIARDKAADLARPGRRQAVVDGAEHPRRRSDSSPPGSLWGTVLRAAVLQLVDRRQPHLRRPGWRWRRSS